VKFKALCGFLFFCLPVAQAQGTAKGSIGNVFVGIYQGEGVGPVFSRGYSAFYSFDAGQGSLWNSRLGVTHLAGNLSKSSTWVKPYRFLSELTTLEYALEFCPVRRVKVHYCPFVPSIGLAKRTIGGVVDRDLGSPSAMEGRTSASTLGTVIEMEQRLKFRFISIGARFQGVFFPSSKLKTVDTFPDEATQEDRRISSKALDAIHTQNSVMSLRIYAGIFF
jgi:hypothetical protein